MIVGDQQWMEDALARLVSIPSVSGNETLAQVEAENMMIEAGATNVRRIPVDAARLRDRYGFESPSNMAGMFSVVGTWQGNLSGPYTVLNGHIDTVEAGVGWNTDPLVPVVLGDRIVGLGSADMKAGLVSAIASAARATASGRLAGRIDIQSVPDEEAGGGTGTLACVDDLAEGGGARPDFAIVCEPTSLRIATTQVGSRSIALTLHGVEAHANTKYRGLSAIELGMDLARELLAWVGALRTEAHPLLPPRALNVGKFAGGDGATKVASLCEVEICITYHPADTDAVVTEIDSIIDTWHASQDSRLRLEVRELHNVRPFSTPVGTALVESLAAAVGSPNGPFIGFPAGSDGRFFSELLGVPTVLFGPGDIATAHRPNEGVPIAELVSHSVAMERFLTEPNTEWN